ncbi:MAG: NUDIX hydrolase [Parachlamydiaceae bacterium]|nr:NUDIX hydrolase [Parachlamydiaceae bacterium]
MRELMEETGIKVSPSQVNAIGKLYVKKPRGAFIYHMFQVDLKEMPEVYLSAEHTKYAWADTHDIQALRLIGGGKEALDYYFLKKK